MPGPIQLPAQVITAARAGDNAAVVAVVPGPSVTDDGPQGFASPGFVTIDDDGPPRAQVSHRHPNPQFGVSPLPASSLKPPILVPHVAPRYDDVHELEATFRYLSALCPVDARGFMDTSPLRNGHDVNARLQFSDGAVVTVKGLLLQHERALIAWYTQQGKRPPDLPGTYSSEIRLMAVLRRVTGQYNLLSSRQAAIIKTIVTVDLPHVQFQSSSPQLQKVLRQAWQASEAENGKLSVEAIAATIVLNKNGEQERLPTLMSLYWDDVKRELKKNKFVTKAQLESFESPTYYKTEDALDMMYYRLFGHVRFRSKWVGSLKAVALPLDEKAPLPDVSTLLGILSVLYQLSQSPFMSGLDYFPAEPKDTLLVIYDPRTGRSFNYEKLMYEAQRLIAAGKADPETAGSLRDITLDARFVADPALAARRFPQELTRRDLLVLVRRQRGTLPEAVPVTPPVASLPTTVVRRRDGVATGVPAIPVGSRLPTQPYLVGDPQVTSPVFMVERFVRQMSFAGGLTDAVRICSEAVQRGFAEAESVARWVDTVVHGRDVNLAQSLRILPQADSLSPIMLPLVMNDVTLRLLTLTGASRYVRARWEAYWESENMEMLTPLARFDRIQRFVLQEETRMDKRPPRTLIDADITQTEPDAAAAPWRSLVVPDEFALAMRGVLGAPDIQRRAVDVSRAFMALMPLDDLPVIQNGHRQADTFDVLYAQLTGRPLDFGEPVLSAADRELRERLQAIAKARGMVEFNGYWVGRGMKIANRDHTIPPTLRFYLALNPKYAEHSLAALNDIYDRWAANGPKDIQLKMTQIPAELVRTDAALFYTDAKNQGIWRDLVALRTQHPEYFRAVVGPPMTAQFLDSAGKPTGISVAQAPRSVRDSANGVAGRLGTAALRNYRTRVVQGQELTTDELLQMTAYYMELEGKDLNRPAFRAGTTKEKPGWVTFADVFRQTDQYKAP